MPMSSPSPDSTTEPQAGLPPLYAKVLPSNAQPPNAQPSRNPKHGTLSTRHVRGEWNENHCEHSECEFPRGHSGPHSHELQYLQSDQRQTRAGRRQQLPPVSEELTDQESEEPDPEPATPSAPTTDDEADLDVLLGTAHTNLEPRYLTEQSDKTPLSNVIAYPTCIDALHATVDLDLADNYSQPQTVSYPSANSTTSLDWEYELATIRRDLEIPAIGDDKILTSRQPHGATVATPKFDMTLPSPDTLHEAILHANWNAENGYRYATIRELKSWVKHKVLLDRGAAPDIAKLLNMRFLYSHKTDKKGKFQRGKLRIIILGHKHAAKKGEHYFENFSHTVCWPNLRATCAQASMEGFTIARQWDTHAAFLYSDAEPGAEVYTRVPKELQEVLGIGETAFVAKAAYGLPSAPRCFEKYCAKVLKDECGLTTCPHDEAVFVRRRGKEFIFVCTWVDDFCVLSNSQELYDETRAKYFGLIDGDDGPLEYLLGVNIEVDDTQSTIKLHCEKMINGISTGSRGIPRAFQLWWNLQS